jgi:Zn-dependent protease/predicted transcriptional regulator
MRGVPGAPNAVQAAAAHWAGTATQDLNATDSTRKLIMKSGLYLGRWFGIDVIVHWTFLLMVALLMAAQLLTGASWASVAGSTTLLMAVFLCVLMHEFGHALTARAFGIRTQDITLLPIGGLARLERIPENPWQEFWFAVAGPAVNVAIVALLWPAAAVMGRVQDLWRGDLTAVSFLTQLISINATLVAFNLLPAFPMDGGRVLRAVLAMFMPYAKATNIAASCGQFMAVLFGIVGFFTNWMLMLVAFFVYFAARGEAQHVQTRSLVRGARVREAMVPRFRGLDPGMSLRTAVEELLADHQQDFPVVERGKVIGVLHRVDLFAGLAQGRCDATVREVMARDCQFIDESMPLDQAFAVMQQSGRSMLPVLHGHSLVGVLTSDNIEEWLMVRAALRQNAERNAMDKPGKYADSLTA